MDPFGWVLGDNEDSLHWRGTCLCCCGVASPSVRLLNGVLLHPDVVHAARQHQMIVLAASYHRHQQSLSLIEDWIYYAKGHCWPPIIARIYLRLLPFETFSLYCVHFLWPLESCHLGQHCILSSDLSSSVIVHYTSGLSPSGQMKVGCTRNPNNIFTL